MPSLQPSPNTQPAVGNARRNASAEGKPTRHTRGLLLVGLFKLSKALAFGCLGLASLHLTHSNLGDLVMRVTNHLPVDPEGRLVSLLMDKADLIGSHQLRQFGFASFAYAIICVVEGTGLILEKVWAEYITVILTVMALPWEVYELIRRPSPFRVGLLLINIVVLVYLLWIIKKKRREESGAES